MLSDTLTDGLEQYKIGPKVRDLRLQKGLGLVQLGEHTGLSAAMLSKIERGQLFPTLPTLLRIAMVFGVGLEHFFVAKEQPLISVVRRDERLRLPNEPGDDSPAYFFESLDFPVTDRAIEAYFAEFPPKSEGSEPHVHAGVELIYALGGKLEMTVDGVKTELEEGDAMYFDSGLPHSYRGVGKAPATAMVVIAAEKRSVARAAA